MRLPQFGKSGQELREETIMSIEWEDKKRLIKWIFEGRCAACGCKFESLEVHHNTYPRLRGEERPYDILPLCWACHPIFEWLRKDASLKFKASIKDYVGGHKRLHRRIDQVGPWAEQYVRQIRATLNEADASVEFLEAMAERWDEEQDDGGMRRAA
jgi:hypothetical protein